jgi:hypothetical protein
MHQVDFKAERYAFWTRVRGCAQKLRDIQPAVDALMAQRDAQIAAVGNLGQIDVFGCVLTARRISRSVNSLIAACNAAVLALQPEPMTTTHEHWKTLRFYPEVVRSKADALAFLDPQATVAELGLALSSGLDILCGRHLELVFTQENLMLAVLQHLLTPCVRLQHERSDVWRDRKNRKSASCRRAFVAHVRTNPKDVQKLPRNAVAVLVSALSDEDGLNFSFAEAILRALPASMLGAHADTIDAAVQTHKQNARELALVEMLIKRVYAPDQLDMALELRRAMGVFCATGAARGTQSTNEKKSGDFKIPCREFWQGPYTPRHRGPECTH